MPKATAGPTLKTRVKARTRCSPACAARWAWVRGKAISPIALPMTIGASMVQWVANAAVIIPRAVIDRAATISVRGSMRSASAALGARVSRRSSPEEPSTNPTTVIGAPSASIQSGQMPT